MTELKSRNIEAEIIQVTDNPQKRRVKKTNNSLSDEELSELLSGNDTLDMSLYSQYSEDDYHEIVKYHRPVFSGGLEKWL
jgi:hypothetical protein